MQNKTGCGLNENTEKQMRKTERSTRIKDEGWIGRRFENRIETLFNGEASKSEKKSVELNGMFGCACDRPVSRRRSRERFEVGNERLAELAPAGSNCSLANVVFVLYVFYCWFVCKCGVLAREWICSLMVDWQP